MISILANLETRTVNDDFFTCCSLYYISVEYFFQYREVIVIESIIMIALFYYCKYWFVVFSLPA